MIIHIINILSRTYLYGYVPGMSRYNNGGPGYTLSDGMLGPFDYLFIPKRFGTSSTYWATFYN